MPLVDLVVDKGGRRWRNRGLRSLPSAHCWEPVARAASGALSVSAFTEEKVKGSETDSIWGPLVEDVDVSEAFAGKLGISAPTQSVCYFSRVFENGERTTMLFLLSANLEIVLLSHSQKDVPRKTLLRPASRVCR